jgi:hypothetical protein
MVGEVDALVVTGFWLTACVTAKRPGAAVLDSVSMPPLAVGESEVW